MTRPGGPDRRGRRSSADGAAGADPERGFQPRTIGGFAPGHETPRYEPARYEPSRFAGQAAPAVPTAPGRAARRHSFETAERATAGIGRSGGVHLDAYARPTYAGGGRGPGQPLSARHSGGDRPGADEPGRWRTPDTEHPSAPLPPRPAGVWDRLSPRHGRPGDDDDATVASPLLPGPPGGRDPWDRDDDVTEAHDPDPSLSDGDDHERSDGTQPGADGPADARAEVDAGAGGYADADETGGLEVIGAHVDDGRRRGRFGRRRAAADHGGSPAVDPLHGQPHEDPHDDLHGDLLADPLHDDDIPVAPYDPSGRRRRRRRPLALLLSLLVLGGLVAGIVVGGQALLGLIDPTAQDYTGQGTGEAQIRVNDGDTLSDIARTLVDAGVIASIGPFVDAAEAEPDATGIQPGVYSMRQEMSGQAALDLLLDPVARQISRVTLPEGLTVRATLTRISEATGVPVAELEAAAADPAALGLPGYAGGQLEGFLFPATYEFEPDTAPAEMLRQMVGEFTEVAGRLQLEQRAAAVGRTPYEVVVIASMIQSETMLEEERPDVAQVIYNRLAGDIPLGIDATLAYGLDKSGNELTVTDLETDSPYNTRTRTGLPPTPISAPGEPSLEAALSPTTGSLLYYVLESAEGRHFFTDDYAEFQAARQRCAEAGLGCGG